jgi:hypothetical protein
MTASDLLNLYTQHQRIDIEYPDMQKEVLPELVRFVRPAPGMSFILYSQLDETNVERVIQEQIDDLTTRGLRFDWKVYAYDTPPDLKNRLVAHGFEPDLEPDNPGAILVLDLEQAPAALLQPITADMRRLTERQQLVNVIRIEEQVWGRNFNWITPRLGQHLEIPGYLSVYVAYVNDQPACSGWVYFHPHSPFASLWGGSTIPGQRGRGLYTAVLAARVQEARQRRYRYLTIDASPMSRPIVAKYGFQVLTYARRYEWKGQPQTL